LWNASSCLLLPTAYSSTPNIQLRTFLSPTYATMTFCRYTVTLLLTPLRRVKHRPPVGLYLPLLFLHFYHRQDDSVPTARLHATAAQQTAPLFTTAMRRTATSGCHHHGVPTCHAYTILLPALWTTILSVASRRIHAFLFFGSSVYFCWLTSVATSAFTVYCSSYSPAFPFYGQFTLTEGQPLPLLYLPTPTLRHPPRFWRCVLLPLLRCSGSNRAHGMNLIQPIQ